MFVADPKGPKMDIVLRLVADVGFEPVDAGDVRAARLLEPLGMLRLQLEETEGRSDLAFLLASRERKQSQPLRACRDSGRHSGAGMNDNETQEMPGPESPRAMKIAP